VTIGLRSAIDNNDLLPLALLLTQIDVDAPSSELEGMTPIMYAIHYSMIESLETIINAGASIEETDEAGYSPLAYAVHRHMEKCVKVLLDAGAKPDVVAGENHIPLHIAVSRGNSGILKLFLTQKINLDVHDADGHTAITLAASRGYPSLLHVLINAGAEINTKRNLTALDCAIAHTNWGCAKLLLRAGAKPTSSQNLLSLLRTCIEMEQIGLTKMLFAHGAHPNQVDQKTGISLMEVVVARGNIEMLEMVMKQGARLDMDDQNSRLTRRMIRENKQLYEEFVFRFPNALPPEDMNPKGEVL